MIHETKALVKQRLKALQAPRQIRQYLSSTPQPLLHLGCGSQRFPGWLNADIDGAVYLDLGRPFPLPDRSVAFVYHEHVIEHLPLDVTKRMLDECFRVMRPDGRMRISCPDFEMLARNYLQSPQYYFETPIYQEKGYAPYRTALQRLCHVVYDFGHHWMWDFESLSLALTTAGFVDIVRVEFGESAHAPLRGLDRERRRSQSMYVEARRP